MTDFEDLVDPRFVPQVDPVGDDAERGHGPAAQEPPYEAPVLWPEDSRDEQEEGEQSVEGLAGQIEVRGVVQRENGDPEM